MLGNDNPSCCSPELRVKSHKLQAREALGRLCQEIEKLRSTYACRLMHAIGIDIVYAIDISPLQSPPATSQTQKDEIISVLYDALSRSHNGHVGADLRLQYNYEHD